jgi:hypothetical protein
VQLHESSGFFRRTPRCLLAAAESRMRSTTCRKEKKELIDAWNDGSGTLPHYPKRSDWSVKHQENGFAVAIGGGVDLVVNRAFAWRIGNVEYTHSWLPNVDQIHASQGVRFTSGLMLRIGTW